ncbi:hypothetical protein G9A89_016165 [Geosiphon pyriformis]|nr:hypothetical protein G9A89_016165 [Geosiphon pyriformis]
MLNPNCFCLITRPSLALSIIELGFNIGVKSAEPRKKRRDGALENNIGNWKFAIAETGDITKSNSVNMEKKCLVEEISFNYGDNKAFNSKDSEHMLKSSKKTITKRMLEKLLEKINFLDDNSDNILLDKLVVLPPPLKNLVNVSIKKSFALDISLDNVVEKSAQEKLVVASTPSKFAGIIRVTFTSELSLVQTSKKTEEVKILVNTNLKKSSGHSNWAVVLKEIPIGTLAEAVHTVLSEFRLIKSIKMQLVGLWQKAVIEFEQIDYANLVTTKWSILIEKNAVWVARSNIDKESWDA